MTKKSYSVLATADKVARFIAMVFGVAFFVYIFIRPFVRMLNL